MNPIVKLLLSVIIITSFGLASAQGDIVLKNDVSKKIKFELINNLIIIPLEVNGVTLSFILDTGVSKPILFNLSESDSLYLKNTEVFYLHGLGADGKLDALKSSYNRFKIGDAVGVNQDLYVIFDSAINFTPRLGVLIHGIIGYDLFKDFVVEINYSKKYMRLYKPDTFEPRNSKKWKSLPLDVYSKKPYVDALVTINDNQKPTKLLIDTGNSDSVWLFEDLVNGLTPNPDLVFIDYLGKGLSGSVYGKRSKLKNLKLSDFDLKNVNVAYPDSLAIDVNKIYKQRDGSLGGDVLKRFNLFFDYTNEKLYLKKNNFYKDLFTYNNSGIVLEHNGVMYVKERINVPSSNGYSVKSESNNNNNTGIRIDVSINYKMSIKPTYNLVEIRESSNAYIAGLRKDDILININGKPAYDYNLSDINRIFHGKTGKSLKLTIERKGKKMSFKFKLDDAFKKNELPN